MGRHNRLSLSLHLAFHFLGREEFTGVAVSQGIFVSHGSSWVLFTVMRFPIRVEAIQGVEIRFESGAMYWVSLAWKSLFLFCCYYWSCGMLFSYHCVGRTIYGSFEGRKLACLRDSFAALDCTIAAANLWTWSRLRKGHRCKRDGKGARFHVSIVCICGYHVHSAATHIIHYGRACSAWHITSPLAFLASII